MLPNLAVILVRPRLSENIGMVARAMANMGAGELLLIQPERWEREKALPLATSQGAPVLDALHVEESLAQALAPFSLAIGGTARSGGLRSHPISPEKAAGAARSAIREGGRAALVFGPEDRGLDNEEASLCTELVRIPTAAGASSLNLAQAVLVLLYECVKADAELPFAPRTERARERPGGTAHSRRTTLEEEQILFRSLEEALIRIGHLPGDNPAHFMRPVRRFLRKSRLRRHEFDMLMGICRQMRNALKK